MNTTRRIAALFSGLSVAVFVLSLSAPAAAENLACQEECDAAYAETMAYCANINPAWREDCEQNAYNDWSACSNQAMGCGNNYQCWMVCEWQEHPYGWSCFQYTHCEIS